MAGYEEYPTCKQINDWGMNSYVECFVSPRGNDGAYRLENVSAHDQRLIASIAEGELLEFLKVHFPGIENGKAHEGGDIVQ